MTSKVTFMLWRGFVILFASRPFDLFALKGMLLWYEGTFVS